MASQYELSLRDYWRILRKRRFLIAFTALMLGIFTFMVSSFSRPVLKYSASAKIQIEKETSPTSQYTDALSSYYGGGGDLETRKGVIRSQKVLSIASKNLGRIGKDISLTEIADTPEYIRKIESLEKSVSIEQEELTDIITISAVHIYPDTAAKIANAVAEAYKDYHWDQVTSQPRESIRRIKELTDAEKDSLAQAEMNLKRYREEKNIISLVAQTSLVLSEKSITRRSHSEAESALDQINDVIKQVDKVGTISEEALESLPEKIATGVFMSLATSLTNLNSEREVLLLDYSERHPQIRVTDIKIAQVKKDMVEELKGMQKTLEVEQKKFKTRLDALSSEESSIPQMRLELERLMAEVEGRRIIVTALEQQYHTARIQKESTGAERVVIIQQAFASSVPINPTNPLSIAVVGSAIGMILGLLFAFIAETMDTSIGTIEDVEEYVGASVVGLIPHIDIEEVKASLMAKGVADQDEAAIEQNARLVAHFDPQSNIAESYRALRTNIQFLTVEKNAKSVLVTSSTQQEGKTTTMVNFAMTMAQVGEKTLLIDTDLRKPVVNKVFGLEREPGMSDVILGNYDYKDVVRTVADIMTGEMGMEDIMMTPGMDNLNIITSGTIPPNPTEILSSQSMKDFIREVEEDYDIVLFDCPPILQATDAAILAREIDGVILVYRVGEVPRNSLKRAKLQLDQVDAQTLGIVLNGARADISSDFYDMRYYYSSYYAYGSEQKEESKAGLLSRLVDNAKSLFGSSNGKDSEKGERSAESKDSETGKGKVARLGVNVFLSAFVAVGFMWQMGLISLGKQIDRKRTENTEITIDRELTETPKGIGEGKVDAPIDKESKVKGAYQSQTGTPKSIQASFAEKGVSKETNADPERDIAGALDSSHETDGSQSVATAALAPEEKDPVYLKDIAERLQRTENLPMETNHDRKRPFSVHVGSYKILENMNLQMERLRAKGYEVFVVGANMGGDTFHRILVGGFENIVGAKVQADHLKMRGHTDYAEVMDLPYGVEIGTFDLRELAQYEADELIKDGYYPYITVADGLDSASFSLMLGAFKTEKEAEAFSQEMGGKGKSNQVILR